MKGKIFADSWIQCGRCDRMEALATRDRKEATAEATRRRWIFRYTAGYICPECVAEVYGAKKDEAMA